jgi:hypothetical protein
MSDANVEAQRLDAELELVNARLVAARAQLRLVRSELIGVLEVLDEITAKLSNLA